LSIQRAHAVREYLRSKGWPDSLFLDVNGLGSSHPLNDNNDAGEKSLNRRVEIIVLHRDASALRDMFKDTTKLVGRNIILHDLNFYAGRHIPLPQGYKVMQELLVIMRQHPSLRVQIQGYVCCNSDGFDGRDEDTQASDLSIQRAKFVYDFLISQGIQKNRMTYKGYGSSNKIFPEEKDDFQMAANRRVEIKIVGL
jgi:outer membrane protein OmpA-like peptidoglycan-associated protein